MRFLEWALFFSMGLCAMAWFISDTIREPRDSHESWVATMSVLTEIANITPESQPRVDQVYPDQYGCAVINVEVFKGQEPRRYAVCPGGLVTTYREDGQGGLLKENRGDDPYWDNLGKPEGGEK